MALQINYAVGLKFTIQNYRLTMEPIQDVVSDSSFRCDETSSYIMESEVYFLLISVEPTS